MVYPFPGPFIPLVLIPPPKRLPISPSCWPSLAFCGPSSLLLSLLLIEFYSVFSLNLVIVLLINQFFIVVFLFLGLGVVYVTGSLMIICKTASKHSFNIIIILLFDVIRIISFIDKSRDILYITLGRDNNGGFV